MDQVKIGRFIAKCRKEQELTQAVLAERLGITDRAVSKWETGKCLPDVAIMLELCAILNITVNELFSGERIGMDKYREMAEQHLLEMRKAEELANRKLLSLEVVIGYMASVTFLVMVFVASFVEMPAWAKVLMIAVGASAFAVGMTNCLKIEHDAGYYECPECGETYIPSMKSVVLAPHIGRNRKMTCPHCGNRAYHRKVLVK